MTDPGDDRWIEHWLSRPRFAVYVAAADGDRPRALALYERNFTVAAAFHHDLGHLEIGLRNAYDRALSSRDRPGDRHWVFEPFRHFPFHEQRAKNGRPFDVNESQRDHIERAIKSAQRGTGARITPGKVIAELPFGFWRYLTVRQRHDPLWVRHLRTAFRRGTDRRDVDNPVGRLHQLRNRVAHHEPLIGADLLARQDDILTVAGLMSPSLRDYLAAHSPVPAALTDRP